MQEINLFIASSYELSDWREAIGDTIRVVSEEKEPKGYRIRMNCWEDFRPEYCGKRKQDEYNEELVKNSQVFIALFATKCGEYTKEEVKIGKHYCPKHLYCIKRHTSCDTTSIDQFLAEENLIAQGCNTESELVVLVRSYIENYILSLHCTPILSAPIDTKTVFATIPDDRKEYRLPFGNMIRSIDDITERWLNMRCRLRKDDVSLIKSSHYYAALLKDTLSDKDEKELVEAIANVSPTAFPKAIVLYYNHEDLAVENKPALKTLIEKAGIFNESFDGKLLRVRFNLFCWLLSSAIVKIDEKTGLRVEHDWITFFNERIAPLALLNIKGSSDAEKLAKLIEQISCRLLLNNDATSYNPNEKIDIAHLDKVLEQNEAAVEVAAAIEEKAKDNLQQIDRQLSNRIVFLIQSDESTIKDNMDELVALVEKKSKIQEKLTGYGLLDPRDLLRTQMLMVQLHDTYPTWFIKTGYDIDHHYSLIANTADRFEVLDPTIEMMRMNYANYLARKNRQTESLQLYNLTISNLNRLDDSSKLIQSYIVHLYITYINHLIHLGEINLAQQTINQLIDKTEKWNRKWNRSSNEILADKVRIKACKLRIRPIKQYDEDLIGAALTLIEELNQMKQSSIPDGIWDDLFCDFPNCVATYLLDTASPANFNKNYNLAFKLLSQVVANASNSNITTDSHHRYTGNAYHNQGFLLFNNGQIPEARVRLKKALQIRRRIYEENLYEADLNSIAETLLLFGATYVQNNIKFLPKSIEIEALTYADECLSIYTALNTDHYLEQETCVYKAKLLRGSILFYSMDAQHRDEGIALLKECQEWNLAHPDNSYKDTFDGVAGVILKYLGLI